MFLENWRHVPATLGPKEGPYFFDHIPFQRCIFLDVRTFTSCQLMGFPLNHLQLKQPNSGLKFGLALVWVGLFSCCVNFGGKAARAQAAEHACFALIG